jgi:hypothetical protein
MLPDDDSDYNCGGVAQDTHLIDAIRDDRESTQNVRQTLQFPLKIKD